MKKQLSFISRSAFVVVAAGAFCTAQTVSAQESSSTPAATATPALSALQPAGQKPRQARSDSSSSTATTTASPMGGNNGRASGPASIAGNTTTKTALDRKDRDFMMAAAKGGMMEVHMGEMAQKMGQSADVKKIGSRMVADHTKTNNELMTLATAKGVKLDTRHKMSKMDSANFDQQYLTEMVADHQKDIAEFQREAQNGADPDVKQFATKSLPILQQHLQMVKAAAGKAPMKKS
jgi:putative membrane protein